jgi:hypothetical protein
MASRVSSDSSELSPQVEPQRVRGLGLTWVKRGPAYWACRAVVVLARLVGVLVFFELAFVGVLVVQSFHMPSLWNGVTYVAMACCAVVGFGFGVREAWRTNATTMSPKEWKEHRLTVRQRNRWTRLLVSRAGVVLLLVALPVSGPFYFGFVLSWLPGVSLGRELPSERGARLDLERQRSPFGRLP